MLCPKKRLILNNSKHIVKFGIRSSEFGIKGRFAPDCIRLNLSVTVYSLPAKRTKINGV